MGMVLQIQIPRTQILSMTYIRACLQDQQLWRDTGSRSGQKEKLNDKDLDQSLGGLWSQEGLAELFYLEAIVPGLYKLTSTSW